MALVTKTMRTVAHALVALVLASDGAAATNLLSGGHSTALSTGTVTTVATSATSCPCGPQQQQPRPRGFETVSNVVQTVASIFPTVAAGEIVFEQPVSTAAHISAITFTPKWVWFVGHVLLHTSADVSGTVTATVESFDNQARTFSFRSPYIYTGHLVNMSHD